ncbi:MAG: zf-HC2 domain-containing protein [Candidatus Krumholzibacteriia bacterium]
MSGACARTAARLDAYLDGTLPRTERNAVAEHLATCAACRRLMDAAADALAALSSGTTPDLVGDVLARTSGSACPRAEALLSLAGEAGPAAGEPARSGCAGSDIDADLVDPGSRALLRGHLENCGPCRDLAEVLSWITPVLPQLAEVEPAHALTDAILARTRPLVRRRSLERRAVRWARCQRTRTEQTWNRWWQRPRFALELAYVATLVVVALAGTPASPLRQVPDQALTIVRAGPGELREIGVAGTLPVHLATWTSASLGSVGRELDGAAGSVRGDLRRRTAAADPAWGRFRRQTGAALEQIRDGRWPQALESARAAGASLGSTWRRWWHPEGLNDGAGSVPGGSAPGTRGR